MMVRDCSGYHYIPMISDEWLKLFEEMKQSSEVSMEIKRIYFDVGATVVFWEDGTKTVVRRHWSDPDDKKAAVCAAVAKKLFGSNSAIEREIREKGQFSKRMQEAMGDTAEAAFAGMNNAAHEFFDSVDKMFEQYERKDNEE